MKLVGWSFIYVLVVPNLLAWCISIKKEIAVNMLESAGVYMVYYP